MKRASLAAAAVIAAATASLTMLPTTPASADTIDTAYQAALPQATAQAASASSVPVTLTLPLVKVGTQQTCTYEISNEVGYKKPSFSNSIYEYMRAKVAGHCDGVQTLTITDLITDKGAAFFSSTYNAPNSDSVNGPYLYDDVAAEQNVPLYTFPGDWHGYGSTLNWTARFHITLKPGWTGDTDTCIGFYGTYGIGEVVQAPC